MSGKKTDGPKKRGAARRRKRSLLRQWLHEMAVENGVTLKILEPETFDAGVMGVTEDGQHVAYSYERIVAAVAGDDGIPEAEAMEFVDYNAVRSLPYMTPNEPIVVHEPPGWCFPKRKAAAHVS